MVRYRSYVVSRSETIKVHEREHLHEATRGQARNAVTVVDHDDLMSAMLQIITAVFINNKEGYSGTSKSFYA